MTNVMCGTNNYAALSGLVGFVESLTRPAIRDVNILSPFRAAQVIIVRQSHEVAAYTNTGCKPCEATKWRNQ